MKAKLMLLAITASVLLPFVSIGATTHLVINQIQVAGDVGADDEFIEIFNPTDVAVSLNGWSIQFKTATGTFPLTAGKRNLPDVSLGAHQYFLIATSGYNGSVAADLVQGSISMPATGGTVFLSNATGFVTSGTDSTVVDKVAYGDSATNSPEGQNAPVPPSESALLRSGDDTNNNLTDFIVTASAPHNLGVVNPTPTPSPAPTPTPSPTPTPQPSPTPSPTPTPTPTPNPMPGCGAAGKIVISEILPASRTNLGFLELQNTGGSDINLKKWVISDGVHFFRINQDTIVKPGAFLVLKGADMKISLDERFIESIVVEDKDGNQIDELKFATPVVKPYVRDGTGFKLGTESTPGATNK